MTRNHEAYTMALELLTTSLDCLLHEYDEGLDRFDPSVRAVLATHVERLSGEARPFPVERRGTTPQADALGLLINRVDMLISTLRNEEWSSTIAATRMDVIEQIARYRHLLEEERYWSASCTVSEVE